MSALADGTQHSRLVARDSWLVATACLLNVYLVFLMADSHQNFAWGTPSLSGVFRGSALIIAAVFVLQRVDAFPRDPLVLALAAYAIVGTVIGLISGNPAEGIARHLFAAVFMGTLYWAGTLLDRNARVVPMLIALALATVLAYIVVMALVGEQFLAGAPLSPQPAMIVIAAGLGSLSLPLLAIGLLLLLIGNKRSFVMGACAAVALAGTIRSGARSLWLKAIILATLFVLSLFIYMLIARYGANLASILGVQSLNRVDSQLTVAVTQTGQANYWTYLTSGRNLEFLAAAAALGDSPLKWLFGAGFGATYEWTYYSWVMTQNVRISHNQPDMVPSYFLMTGGLVFMASLTAVIVVRIFQVALFATTDRRLEVVVPALFVFGWAVDNFWSFAPNTALFWLLLGYLVSLRKQATAPAHP